MVKTFKELGSIMAKEEKSAPIIEVSKSKDDLIVEAILNTIRDAGLETDKEVTDEEFKVGNTLPATLKHSVEILVEISDAGLTITTRKVNNVLIGVAKWLRKLEENSNNE
jgi:hypothetical protein